MMEVPVRQPNHGQYLLSNGTDEMVEGHPPEW